MYLYTYIHISTCTHIHIYTPIPVTSTIAVTLFVLSIWTYSDTYMHLSAQKHYSKDKNNTMAHTRYIVTNTGDHYSTGNVAIYLGVK